MVLGLHVARSQTGLGSGPLAILGARVHAVGLFIEEAQEAGGFDERLGTDAVLGEEDGRYGCRGFGDDLRGRGVEPLVRPALEDIDIRLTKGASTCPP